MLLDSDTEILNSWLWTYSSSWLSLCLLYCLLSYFSACLSSFSWMGDPLGSVSSFLFCLYTLSLSPPFSNLTASMVILCELSQWELSFTERVSALYEALSTHHLTECTTLLWAMQQFLHLDEEAEAQAGFKTHPWNPRPPFIFSKVWRWKIFRYKVKWPVLCWKGLCTILMLARMKPVLASFKWEDAQIYREPRKQAMI